jgi:PPOX class probable FMN-dependent enzyme
MGSGLILMSTFQSRNPSALLLPVSFILANLLALAAPMSAANTAASKVRWRLRLDAAIGRNKKERGSNFVQLATVDHSGAPRCRTVVLRGFEPAAGEGGDVLRMITDTRSDKIPQLIARQEVELNWWFGKTSEQFRISGPCEIVAQGAIVTQLERASPPAAQRERLLAARKQQWGNLSDQAREQFFMPSPGRPLGEEAVGVVPAGGRDEAGKVVEPPDTFALLLVRPRRVDYLCLSGNLRQIDCADAPLATADEGGADAGVLQWSETLVVG